MQKKESEEWGKATLLPILEFDRARDSIDSVLNLPHAGNLALLSADTDQIKQYVFESPGMPEVRGASMFLTQLNKEGIKQLFEERNLPGDCIIYADGGSLVAIVPKSEAPTLQREIESLYPRETGLATITCVWQTVTPRELIEGFQAGALSHDGLLALKDRLSAEEWKRIADYYHQPNEEEPEVTLEQFQRKKNFGQMVRLMGIELRKAKESKELAPFHESMPFAFRCASCQIRPASGFVEVRGERQQFCNACARKLEDRRAQKSRWTDEFRKFLEGPEKDELRRRYYTELAPREVDYAQDFGEIGAASKAGAGGYIGFVYADGNDVGAFVEGQASPREYKENSEAIGRATTQAVYQALAENLHPYEVERRTLKGRKSGDVTIDPFEVLTIGGDDVLLIVPGDVAIPIALRVCQLFSLSAPQSRDGEPLTMSVGAVVADSHNPVRFLSDLADELNRSAKRRSRSNGGGVTIDFLILKSQSMLRTQLEQLRNAPPYRLTTEETKKDLQLTSRPYSLREMQILLRLLREFKRMNFPKSQLHALADSLQDGRHVSSLFYLYQQVRLKEKGKLLERLGEDWKLEPQKDPIPWQRVLDRPGIGFRTILLDLAELYELMPQLEGEELDQLWAEILGEG